MMNITMITRSLTLALVTTSVPALHAATTWTEARNDAMGAPVWHHPGMLQQRWSTPR